MSLAPCIKSAHFKHSRNNIVHLSNYIFKSVLYLLKHIFDSSRHQIVSMGDELGNYFDVVGGKYSSFTIKPSLPPIKLAWSSSQDLNSITFLKTEHFYFVLRLVICIFFRSRTNTTKCDGKCHNKKTQTLHLSLLWDFTRICSDIIFRIRNLILL